MCDCGQLQKVPFCLLCHPSNGPSHRAGAFTHMRLLPICSRWWRFRATRYFFKRAWTWWRKLRYFSEPFNLKGRLHRFSRTSSKSAHSSHGLLGSCPMHTLKVLSGRVRLNGGRKTLRRNVGLKQVHACKFQPWIWRSITKYSVRLMGSCGSGFGPVGKRN